MPVPSSSLRAAAARGLARFVCLFLGAAIVLGIGCSKHETDEGEEDPFGDDGGTSAAHRLDASSLDAADGSDAHDARADEERAALLDAGRFCGEKDLPECPLQLWMKRNANTMITFGETTTLAEVFDQIAEMAPPARGLTRETFANWISIARDGAVASRVGNLQAAKAACRGCHTQYRERYHAELRALPLPVLPAGAPSAP
jgi:hypothetical protein